MIKPAVVAAVFCAALLGCQEQASAGSIEFQAPPGWESTPNIMGSPQMFRNPGDAAQVILIAYPREPKPGSHPTSETWTSITICGNHPATLMEKRGTLDGKAVQMDGVDTSWNGVRVMAMYARPFGTPANPAAEDAIRSLCEAAS